MTKSDCCNIALCRIHSIQFSEGKYCDINIQLHALESYPWNAILYKACIELYFLPVRDENAATFKS